MRRIVMQDDVKAAVAFVESQITRLLAGHCELWEFVMTGVGTLCPSSQDLMVHVVSSAGSSERKRTCLQGLWRVTGQQVEAAAVAGEGQLLCPFILPSMQVLS